MYRSPQQQLGADCYCCVKLHQDTWQLCSQADHLTSHMLHIQETSEGPNTRTSQVVGCFFLTVTLFKRDSVNVRTAQRPTEAHISDGISLVRPAMKLLPPFSSSTYCGVQLPTLLPNMYETQFFTSTVGLWCVAMQNYTESGFMVTSIANTIF